MKKQSRFKFVAMPALLLGLTLATATSQAGLIGFYPFDDASTPRKDESVSGLGMALASSTDPTADPVFAASAGVSGGAYTFNGSQRLVTPFDINPGSYPALTMGAWVKSSTLASGLRKVIGNDDGGWDRALGLDNRQNGVLGFATFTGGGVLNSAKAPASTNDWSFVAVAFDSAATRVSLYVDTDVSTGGPLLAFSAPTTIGDGFPQAAIGGVRPDQAAEGWEGVMDNLFFYDSALTQAQLTDIRDRGKNAILGVGAKDDPDLGLASAPNIDLLQRIPEIQTFTYPLSNGGATKTLNIRGVTFTGPDAGHFTLSSFPATIAPQASSNLTIQFNNRGQVGTFVAQMVIASDDQSTTNFVIELNPRVVSPALLGFYSFDDATTPLKDDSGAKKTLTAPVMPEYVAAGGVQGGAVVFDGSQRLAAPININPATVPNLTMGAWVKTDVFDGLHKIMGHDNGGWDRTLGLDNRGADGTTYYTAFAGRDAYPQTDPLAVPDNAEAWSFVSVVYEAPNNLVTTYIDLDVSSKDDLPLSGSTTTTVGAGVATVGIGGIAPTGTGEAWIGSIDNAFFIAGALNPAQIKQLRDDGKAFLLSLTPDPILSLPTTPVFGDLPSAAPTTVNLKISNAGATQPLRISRAVIIGPDAPLYSFGTLPAEIAPGAEATIPITITPGSRQGGTDAQLGIYSSNAGDRLTTVSLAAFVPFATPRAALVAFYPFDNAASPLEDASGNGATASLVPDFEATYAGAGGVSGGAYTFEGAQRLSAPVNISPSVIPKLTMGAWVKTATVEPGLYKIMGHDDGGWDRTLGIDTRGTGGLTTHHYTAFAGRDAYPLTDPPATPVSTEEWTFAAAVYDQFAATVTTYIDLNVATTTDPLQSASVTTTMGPGSTALGIGAISASSGEFWIGSIDNVFVYRTALTAAQLTAIRDGGAAAILGSAPADLRITGVQRGADLKVTWASKDGQSYKVQYVQTITGTWEDIATVSGTGSSTTYTDTNATRLGRSTGFYRIVQP